MKNHTDDIRQELQEAATAMQVEMVDFEHISDRIDSSQRQRQRQRVKLAAASAALVFVGCLAFIALPSSNSSGPRTVLAEGDRGALEAASPEAGLTSGDRSLDGITIETALRPAVGGRANLLMGVLRVDLERGCLYFDHDNGTRFHVIFPHGFTIVDNPLRVLDSDEEVFAVVGSRADYGGSHAYPEPVQPGAGTCGAELFIRVWKM